MPSNYGIVASSNSIIPIVSSLSLGISGSYSSQGSGTQGFSYTGSGPFTAIHTDIQYINSPLTVTATLSGVPESGAGYSINLSGKPVYLTFSLNGVSGVPIATTTNSSGQAVFTLSGWNNNGDDGSVANFAVQFNGENSGQIIYPSSRSYNANFYSYDVGGAA
jgi:hypothetical protein